MIAAYIFPVHGAQDQSKRKKTAIPEAVEFATKPQLAQQMLESAINEGIRPVCLSLTRCMATTVRSGGGWKRLHKLPYLLTVNKKQPVVIGWQRYRAEDLVPQSDFSSGSAWVRGAGSKGERYYDWARVAVNCDKSDGCQRWLLFRRCLEHPDDPRFISYYQVFAKNNTTLETMAQIAGQRWRIEECFKFAKDQLGLENTKFVPGTVGIDTSPSSWLLKQFSQSCGIKLNLLSTGLPLWRPHPLAAWSRSKRCEVCCPIECLGDETVGI